MIIIIIHIVIIIIIIISIFIIYIYNGCPNIGNINAIKPIIYLLYPTNSVVIR